MVELEMRFGVGPEPGRRGAELSSRCSTSRPSGTISLSRRLPTARSTLLQRHTHTI